MSINHSISFEGMRVFVTVSEAGSFSAAATRLGVAQPTISRQVAQLESALGVQLLRRTTRRLTLTDAGELYLDRAKSILADVENATDSVRQEKDTATGLLHVSAPASLGQRVIAPLLAKFHHQYPGIQIGLSLSDSIKDLIEYGFDVAIRFGEQKDSGFVARKLASSRSIICASDRYLQRVERIVSPSDLQDKNCLIFRQGPGVNDWHFEKNGETVSVQASGSMYSDTGDALQMAAIEGLGIVHLPLWLVQEAIGEGKLTRILEAWEILPFQNPVFAVYPERRHRSLKVMAFVSFLEAELPQKSGFFH